METVYVTPEEKFGIVGLIEMS